MHQDGKPFNHLILGPYPTEYLDKSVLNIFIDGLLFSFILGDVSLTDNLKGYILNKSGNMSISNQYLKDHPNLIEAVTQLNNEFKDLFPKTVNS